MNSIAIIVENRKKKKKNVDEYGLKSRKLKIQY